MAHDAPGSAMAGFYRIAGNSRRQSRVESAGRRPVRGVRRRAPGVAPKHQSGVRAGAAATLWSNTGFSMKS